MYITLLGEAKPSKLYQNSLQCIIFSKVSVPGSFVTWDEPTKRIHNCDVIYHTSVVFKWNVDMLRGNFLALAAYSRGFWSCQCDEILHKIVSSIPKMALNFPTRTTVYAKVHDCIINNKKINFKISISDATYYFCTLIGNLCVLLTHTSYIVGKNTVSIVL